MPPAVWPNTAMIAAKAAHVPGSFMVKAKARISELILQSEILVLASHDLHTVSSFCERGLVFHHGELAFDQFFMVRPVPGAAQHRTPLPGLYLCGAGCHPGGGIMGTAGRNAARQVLEAA